MARVYDGYGEVTNALDTANVVVLVRVIQHELTDAVLAVVYDVAGEEGPSFGFLQSHRTGRVTRNVHDFEGATSQINDIPVAQHLSRRGRLDLVRAGVEPLRPAGLEHLIVDVPILDNGGCLRWMGQDVGFVGMHGAMLEFMVDADVIAVSVGAECEQRLAGQKRNVLAKRGRFRIPSR